MSAFPKLAYACPIRWEELAGTEREKFCSKCGHRVSNLSLMSAGERAALLAGANEGRLCVSFYRRLSGEYVTPESPLTPHEKSKIAQFGVAALSAGMLALAAGCVSAPPPNAREEPKPTAIAAPEEGTVILQAFGVVATER